MSLLAIKLLVDFLMIMLLGATIFYCMIVNKRIRVLQDSKEDFAKLIGQFDETTKKAQESIEDLQKMAGRVTDSLNERLDKANFLADDLAFMIEKGNKVADKMDGTLPKEDRMGKTALPPKREPAIGRKKKTKAGAGDAEETLMKAAGRGAGAKRGKRDKVESMLERLADSEKDEKAEKKAPRASRTRRAGARTASTRVKSKAEQELQAAMKSGGDA